MKALRFFPIAVICFLCACDTSLPTDVSHSIGLDRGVEVSYMLSEGHFVENWYTAETNPICLIFRDYDCFDEYFSIAWIQGMDGSKLITGEKMEGGFVLSIIYQGRDVSRLGIERIGLREGTLIVDYGREILMEGASFTGNYHVTVLIDDCAFDSVMLYENGKRVMHASIAEVECE